MLNKPISPPAADKSCWTEPPVWTVTKRGLQASPRLWPQIIAGQRIKSLSQPPGAHTKSSRMDARQPGFRGPRRALPTQRALARCKTCWATRMFPSPSWPPMCSRWLRVTRPVRWMRSAAWRNDDGLGSTRWVVTFRYAWLLHHVPKQTSKRYKLNSCLQLMDLGD